MIHNQSSEASCSSFPENFEHDKFTHAHPVEGIVPNGQTCDDCNNLTDEGFSTRDTSAKKQQSSDSNEKMLTAAFFSFMSFTIIQTIAAYIAHSEAMMGDSAAMCVDALSYAINLIAECEKRSDRTTRLQSIDTDTDNDLNQLTPVSESNQDDRLRKRKILLELAPPILSICALLLVTMYTTKKALKILLAKSIPRTSTSPNTLIMTIFSSLNLLLDILNLLYFMRSDIQTKSDSYSSLEDSKLISDIEEDISIATTPGDILNPTSNESDENVGTDRSAESETNLNMCSAYTHVIADTIRSVAVLIAAAVANISSSVTPEKADAMAAIVVALIIVLSLIPLLQRLYRKCLEFRRMEEAQGFIDYPYRKLKDTAVDAYECVKLIPKS